MTNEQIELLSKQLFKKEYLEQNNHIITNFISDMKMYLKTGDFGAIKRDYAKIDIVLKNEQTMAAGLLIIEMAEANYKMQEQLKANQPVKSTIEYNAFLDEKKDMFFNLKHYLVSYNAPANYDNINTFKEAKINASKTNIQNLSVSLENEKKKLTPDEKQIETYEMLIEVYQHQIEIIESIGDFTQKNSFAAFQANYEKWVDIKIDELKAKLFKEYKPIKKDEDDEREIEKVEAKVEQVDLELSELEKYEKIADAYYKMRDNLSDELVKAMIKYPEATEERYAEYVDHILKKHEDLAVLDSYTNKDKMVKELKEDIVKVAKEKSKTINDPKEKGKNGKLYLKCLAGAGGFVAGVGISAAVGAVPILGTAITIYTGARMTYQAGKLVCNIATKINKGQEPKVITKIKENVPEKIKKGAQLLFDKPKNPYMKWFVNGASLGYLADQVFDISGKIGNALTANQPVATNTVTPAETAAAPVDPIGDTMSMTDVYSGKSIDLSSIEYGYSNSYADTPVHLMQQLGKGAVYDKSNVVDGVEWLHFKSLDGDGYAWFPKDQIEALLSTTVRSK